MNTYFVSLLLVISSVVALTSAHAEKIENFSEYYKQDCTFVKGGEVDGNDWCNRGNAQGKAPNVVIVGDSFGNSFTTVFEEYVRTNGKGMLYEQYAQGQCPALLGYGPELCRGFAKIVYERIKKNHSAQTVVLASHWIYYTGETRSWNETSLVATRVDMQKALSETIKAYQALGKKVVFIYHPPEIALPKACAQRRIRIAAAEDQCQLTKADAWKAEAYRPVVDPILEELKVAFLDPFTYMCDDKMCKVKDGEKIFFASQAHLSGFGGQYLARKAAPELKKLLQF